MESTSEVRPLLPGIITPAVYTDVVLLGLQEDTQSEYTPTSSGGILKWEESLECNSFIDRKVALQFKAIAEVTGDQAAPFNVDNLNSAMDQIVLRKNPITSTCSSMNIKINNHTFSYSPNLYLDALSRFNGGDGAESVRLADSPVYSDYGSYGATGVVPGTKGAYGIDNFQTYPNPSFNARSTILPTSITQNNLVTSLTFEWVEYIYLPPFTTYDDMPGFKDINNISISLKLPADLKVLFSTSLTANVNTLTNVPALVANDQKMIIRSVTPPSCIEHNFLGGDLIPGYVIGEVTNDPVQLAIGASSKQTLNLIKGNTVPSKILIVADRGPIAESSQANTYGLITGLSMKIGNKTQIFNDITPRQIWKRFVWDKGFKIPYSLYENYTGAPLMIEPSDFPDCCPMIAGSPICANIQITVTVKNIYYEQADIIVNTFPIYDSIITYTHKTLSTSDILVDPKAIIDKMNGLLNEVPRQLPAAICRVGGGLKEDILSALSSVLGGVEAAGKFLSNNKDWVMPLVADLVNAGASVAEAVAVLFGAGLQPKAIYANLSQLYPEHELQRVFANLKEAGCCGCQFADLSYAGKMGKKRGKKGGVMIEHENDFAPDSKMSARQIIEDRS